MRRIRPMRKDWHVGHVRPIQFKFWVIFYSLNSLARAYVTYFWLLVHVWYSFIYYVNLINYFEYSDKIVLNCFCQKYNMHMFEFNGSMNSHLIILYFINSRNKVIKQKSIKTCKVIFFQCNKFIWWHEWGYND